MGLDTIGDLAMSLRKLAPMGAGFHMVNGMIAVVEKHEIGKAADEITGVVIVGFFVRMDVLDIVEHHDGEQGDLLRDDDIEQRFPPIQNQRDDDEQSEGKILEQG